MTQSLINQKKAPNDPIASLQEEIESLERELEKIKKELGAFEIKIKTRLGIQINRLQELSELYKKQKKEKKAKRLEQKRRGKNYKEPKQLIISDKQQLGISPTPHSPEQKELKRLFKEAVVLIHPDKFVQSGEEDKIQRATAITAQLNGIYKRGDLEELINFYQFIVNENTFFSKDELPGVVKIDHKAQLASLKKKKESLLTELEKIKGSYTYNVLISYKNPVSFIDELQIYFDERIKLFEKRTRKG